VAELDKYEFEADCTVLWPSLCYTILCIPHHLQCHAGYWCRRLVYIIITQWDKLLEYNSEQVCMQNSIYNASEAMINGKYNWTTVSKSDAGTFGI